MQYRQFGPLDWNASALGFGAMRLPRIDSDWGRIDEPEATRMLRYAIDHGVNYVDTAYPYHHGASESFLGRALQDGYRERVRLASKMPCWEIEVVEDFDRFLDEQLQKLQTDHVDFYLLHGLREDRWHRVHNLDVLTWAEKAIADGRIGHLGFSFHDRYELFEEIVDASDLWTLCQIQYNYMDVAYQAGARGLEYASSKDLAVVIMEPLRGGQLTNQVPTSIQAIWDGASIERTPADWALQWLWNQPAVSVVLSGMSTMEHVEENVESAARSRPGLLTEGELTTIGRVQAQYRALCPLPCTGCRYCLPCPSGVNVPGVFEIYASGITYEDERRARIIYNDLMKEEERADQCSACGECLTKCPQRIEIPEWLARAHDLLFREEARSAQP